MTSIRLIASKQSFSLFGSVAVLLLCAFSQLHALAFGPPYALFQDIPPGHEVDVEKVANFAFRVPNESAVEQGFNVQCLKPVGDHTKWEYGYEAIPDLTWCKMNETSFTVPAKTTKKVGMTIMIPDRPENYNRKFVVMVKLSSGIKPGIGVGMSLIVRVMIETTINKDVAKLDGDSIAFAPGEITLKGKPGTDFNSSVLLKNLEKYDLTLDQTDLSKFYEPYKFDRYQSGGFQLMVNKTWIEKIKDLSIKAEATQRIVLKGKIPEDAKSGSKHEELVFLRPQKIVAADDIDKDGLEKAILAKMSFLRIKYIVE